MKKFGIIGLIVCLAIIAALFSCHHKRHSSITPITEAHVYMIVPDVFFAGLQHLITPKVGESRQQLLIRYFKQQGIYLEDTNAVEIFVQEGTETGRLQVHVTSTDQDKVERLIVQIAKAK
jgi:hypothetical protein